jgi:hypothetical protein
MTKRETSSEPIRKGTFARVLRGRTLLPIAMMAGALGSLDGDSRADEIDEATGRGVAFLLKEQDKSGAIREFGMHDTAMTSLSLLAMAAVGHLPGDPTPEGEAAQRALDFLLSKGVQDADGYFGARDNSRMYGHGIATLALSELLGMSTDGSSRERLREACKRGVELILRAQKVQKSRKQDEGGWRYTPKANDSDLSVSIWQLMALRSAKNAGLEVPSDAIDRAVSYIRNSFRKPPNPASPTGFSYTPGTVAEWSTAAEGLLALQVCGEYESMEVKETSDWLLKNPPKGSGTRQKWFYYGTYYYAQGMHQRGGQYATESANFVREALLPMQEKDGNWKAASDSEKNRIYCTAMALLSLSVKYHFLPIYQR